MKKQELILRFSSKNQERNQETFSRNDKENRAVSRTFFEKARIFTLTNVYNFGFYQTRNEKLCLITGSKEKQKDDYI